MSFFSELKRRNVIRMAVLYAVAGWVLLQVADVLFEPLGLPPWTFRLVLGLLALGFPFVLIFAWVFEMTPEGLKRERDIDRNSSIVARTGHKMNVVIVALLVVAIAGIALNRFFPEHTAPGAATPTEVTGSDQNAGQPATESEADADAEPSIAVLPFINMSGDPENEYFSDGLTEELLNTLVRLGGLRVTGRTSSFAFKGRSVDMREIGQALNVDNLLEGSVRKAGNQVRVTAQLVKASDGYHLWSDTFDRKLDDIFAIQREISEQVTEALHVALLGDRQRQPEAAEPVQRDPKAYEQYQRGMYTWQHEPDILKSLKKARAYFEAALAIDPQYTDAIWGMFRVWDRMHRNAEGSFDDAVSQMEHYAAELERLAPDSDRTLMATAQLAIIRYDFREAAALLKEAMDRYPASVEILTSYASTVSSLAEYGNALEAIDRAERLDPLSLDVLRVQSRALYRVGDCRGVESAMKRADKIQPDMGRFRYYLAMCLYETTGDIAAAIPYAEAEPLNWANETALAILYRAKGDKKAAQEKFETLMGRAGTGASYQFAQIYAQWGDTEKALEWLQTAIEVRDPGITQAGDDRLLAPLKGNPKFDQMLHDIGLR